MPASRNEGLHVGVAGPIACAELRDLLDCARQDLPLGYCGAPLMSVLIHELLRSGLRVSAFTTSSDLADREVFRAKGLGLELIVVPSRRRAWRPNGLRPGRIVDGFAHERRMLSQVMRVAAPDVIHAHWTYEFALAALASATPTLVTCHDASWEVFRHTRSPYRLIRHLMARQVLRKAKHMTVVSPYMASMLRSFKDGWATVVPNPIAAYALSASRCRDLPASRRVAMVCNGWDKRKNPEQGIRAFSIFRRQVPSAELNLFGNAFAPGQMGERWVRENGLADSVRFVGPVAHRQLIEQLQEMDALLHPALEESFGVVIAEAMALGLPVVAGVSSGAVPWVLGRDRGCVAASLLCDVEDAEAMAQALVRLFGSEYAAISEAGVKHATSCYSPDSVTVAYTAAYRSAILGDPQQ